MKYLLLAFTLLFGLSASAATVCIGPSATGSGSGADWNNLKAWSGTPARGESWYLVNGTYSSKTLSTANSGTTLITIKKATVADHGGISAGWVNSMGDGQATIGSITTTTSYWMVDGNRATSPWDACNPGSFGILINVSDGGSGVDIQNANTNNSFINLDVNGPGFHSTTSETHAFLVAHGGNPWVEGLLISKCRCQNMDTMIKCDNWNNAIIEYTTLRYCSSGNLSAVHPDTMYFYTCANTSVRYCFFGDVDSESIFFDFGGSTGIYFYGNVMVQGTGASSSAIELKQGFTWGTFFVYNNVFKDWSKGVVYRANAASGSITANNIFWNCDNNTAGSTSDYNGYIGVTAVGTHTTTSSIDPFINSGALNFRLNSSSWPINAGTTLGSPWDIDPDGNARGADGTYDLGAFEFVSGGGGGGGGATISVKNLRVGP